MNASGSDAAATPTLAKKLRRFFNEVRREAKRNPAFAARLEAALDIMTPESLADIDQEPDISTNGFVDEDPPLEVNPVAIARREGVDGLRAVIEALPETALRGLIIEHNLDPAEQSHTLRRDSLVEFITAQAARRIDRDKKLFEY